MTRSLPQLNERARLTYAVYEGECDWRTAEMFPRCVQRVWRVFYEDEREGAIRASIESAVRQRVI